jgi:hypothetical protein
MSQSEFRCRLRPRALELATDENGKPSSETLEIRIGELQEELLANKVAMANGVPSVLIDQFHALHEAIMVLQTMIISTTAAGEGELEFALQQLGEQTMENQVKTFEKIAPENKGLNVLKDKLFHERELNKEPVEIADKEDKDLDEELERD